MVSFDNYGSLKSVLKFHIFLILTEETIRIRLISEGPILRTCEELVLNFHKYE